MNPDNEYSEIKKKIIEGLNLAYKKLVEKTAKEDGELSFSENGKIKIVKARDLLKNKQ